VRAAGVTPTPVADIDQMLDEIERGYLRDYATALRPTAAIRVIFVDSNIPMYLIGSAHPHRQTLKGWW